MIVLSTGRDAEAIVLEAPELVVDAVETLFLVVGDAGRVMDGVLLLAESELAPGSGRFGFVSIRHANTVSEVEVG